MNIILIIILLVIILILIWALLGGKSDIMGSPGEDSREQEATFRRRASDKEIEEKYPEEEIHPHRRKTDPHEKAASEEPEAPFKLPYLADEIIPTTSRFRIYRRTLLNSEIYAEKGDFATAISLYEGVKSRIQDVDTRFKIDANIEYLKHNKKRREEETKRKEEQAKRGEASGPGSGSEIKITLGGSLPGSINIDSLPETINIDVIDPNRSLDMESIVDRVTRKMKGDLDEVRGEMELLKRAPLQEAGITGKRTPGGGDDIAGIGRGIRELGRAISDMTASQASLGDREPSHPAAKFDSRDGFPGMRGPGDMRHKVPGQKAPPPSPISAPETSSSEHVTKKTSEEDEGDEFELISEFGKDRADDELTDEEIFEKILLDDAKDRSKQDFEILGEKKDRSEEYVTTGSEVESKQKEEESFYRKLLSTTKRKQKELPILKVSYDFSKLPDELGLSREKNIIEYAFYKYKPMLEKANDFIKKRKVRDAINYYKVVMSQNIPPEFKTMIRKNLDDLNEYLGKYLTGD